MPWVALSPRQPWSASQPLWPRCPAISGLFSTQARERVNPCAGRVGIVRPILAHGTMQPPAPHEATRLSRCHGPARGSVRRRMPASVSEVQPASPSEHGVRTPVERVADAPREAPAQLLGQRARARAQPVRRLPRKRHVDVCGARRLEPAGIRCGHRPPRDGKQRPARGHARLSRAGAGCK